MTDIIERLRYYRMECGDFPALDVLTGEAADEIEKLRGEVAKWQGAFEASEGWRVEIVAECDAAVARYEYVRRLNVPQFQNLFIRSLKGLTFDNEVDAAIDAARGEK